MSLVRFLLGRLVGLVATMFIASVVVFGGLYLAPGTPLGFLTGGRSLPPETIAAITAQYGLDKPLPARYLDWIVGVLHGDFGQSIIYQQSVTSLLGPRLLTTVLLLIYAAILIALFGVGAGLVAAVKSGWPDLTISLGASLGLAIPAFIAAILLIAVFSVGLGWFPVFGPGTGLLDRLWHLTLPAIALALAATAYVARITRAAAKEELVSDHYETATIRGIPRRLAIRRHVTRNAMIPIATVVGLTSASLIAGSVIVDQAFALNGLGSYLVSAVNQHDYPVVQAITLIMVAAFVIINTLVDMTYPLLDPRIRLGGGSR
jgi:peptide/nickel transport system permease protein